MVIKNLAQIIIIVWLVLISIFTSSNSYAGIEKLIKSVMPSGTMNNVTRSAIVQDQLAGHIIGGSVLINLSSI